MRLRHVLSAAIAGIGLGGSFAHATLSVSLVPVTISGAATSADPTLSGARTYDIDVTQTGEQFQVADIKIQLAGGSSGSFYLGGSGAAAAYNTSVNTPSGSVTILGDSDYPSQTQANPLTGVMTSSSFDMSWGQYNFTNQADGKYQIGRITVVGSDGAYLTGYVAGTGGTGRDFLQNNATGALGTSLAAAMPDPAQSSAGGVMYLPIAGDTDYDGAVGGGDFTIVENNFGATGGTPGAVNSGDVDNDGAVGGGDFTIVENNFGDIMPAYSAPTNGSVADGAVALGALVPEPTSLAMLGLVAGSLITRRRK